MSRTPLPTTPPTLDPEVLALRQQVITSTESPSLFGCGWESRLDLWLRKQEGRPREVPTRRQTGLGGTVDPLVRGLVLEESVARLVAIETGYRVHKMEGFWRHPEIEGMGASSEYELIHPAAGPLTLEIKTAGYFAYKRWTTNETGDVLLKAAYEVQGRHQLMCSPGSQAEPGAEHVGSLVVVLVAGDELAYFPPPEGGELRWFPRDPGFEARLAVEVDKFWWSIAAGEPPDPDFERDLEAVVRMQNELMGDSKEKLRVSMLQDPEYNKEVQRYLEAREVEKGGREEKEKAGTRLRHLSGPASIVVSRHGIVQFPWRDAPVCQHCGVATGSGSRTIRVDPHRVDRKTRRRRRR